MMDSSVLNLIMFLDLYCHALRVMRLTFHTLIEWNEFVAYV